MCRLSQLTFVIAWATFTPARLLGDVPLLKHATSIPSPSGGALVAANVDGDDTTDLIVVADQQLHVFLGRNYLIWSQMPDVSTELQSAAAKWRLRI